MPIIAVTAVAIQGARERCVAAGMDDYLTKPIVSKGVADVLERWLANPGGDATWTPELQAPVAEPDDEPIDRAALEALRQIDPEGADTFVTEVVHDFTTEVSARFGVMRNAVAEGDITAIVHECHFIAGCASLVGAMRVESLARSLDVVGPT